MGWVVCVSESRMLKMSLTTLSVWRVGQTASGMMWDPADFLLCQERRWTFWDFWSLLLWPKDKNNMPTRGRKDGSWNGTAGESRGVTGDWQQNNNDNNNKTAGRRQVALSEWCGDKFNAQVKWRPWMFHIYETEGNPETTKCSRRFFQEGILGLFD